MDECPVCGTFVDCAELETHVNAHFEQEQPPCSAVETVICPLGCGQQIPLAELDAHERTALCLG